MSGFTADWLALRAPFDVAARSRPLARRFVDAIPRDGRIVDLGSGTGANLRYLLEMTGAARRWWLVDMDAALLAHAPIAPGIEHRQADLQSSIEELVGGAAAVTASALLDLVSAAWLDRLADSMTRHRLPGLFALNYDGRMSFTPADPADSIVIAAFNRHQTTDKGFGPASGPDAVRHLGARLLDAGASLATDRSDWTIASADTAMASAMIDGILTAALSMAPDHHAAIAGWAQRRRAQIAAGALALVIGHLDLCGTWA